MTVRLLIQILGMFRIDQTCLMRQQNDIRTDSFCNLKMVLAPLRHFFERGTSRVAGGAPTGDSRVEDKDVWIRFGHQELSVLVIERISNSQQIQVPRVTKHLD